MFATAACSILLTFGQHYLVCRANYLHISPITHQRYWHKVERGSIQIGTSTAICSGEGHPDQLIFFDLGEVVCVWTRPLFNNGFESGDTDKWSRSSP